MNKGFADLCLTTWLRRRTGEHKRSRRRDEAARALKAPSFRPSSARLHPNTVERETRLELATLALARRCSTTELLPHSKKTAVFKVAERNVPRYVPLSQHR